MTTVTLYKDINPTATTPSVTFDSSTIVPEMSNLSLKHMEFTDWNDKVSSIEISGGSATFYGNIDYNNGPPETQTQTWSMTLQPGKYGDLLHPLEIPNDQLSSVKVPAGVTVTLYKDTQASPFVYGGEHLVITQDDPDLINHIMDVSWDNQASAIQVSGGSVKVYDEPTNTVLGPTGNIGFIGNLISPGTATFGDTGGKVVNLTDSGWNDRISAISFP